MSKKTPLEQIRNKRELTLRDLFIEINREIKLSRLSDINIGRNKITKNEIEILNKYLNLSKEEIEQLEKMEEDEELKKADELFINLFNLIPDNFKAGEEVIKACPNCKSNLRISKNRTNGHLWIVCEKEGVLLCQ